MTAVALVCWQWISPILETYIDELGGLLPYTNPEATFISVNNGRQHKTCLLFGSRFLGFLVLSLYIVHKINSKMAITVFRGKAWFLQRQKACLCGLLFAGLWFTFSVETHLGKSTVNFVLVLERITQEMHIDRPVFEHLTFLTKNYNK